MRHQIYVARVRGVLILEAVKATDRVRSPQDELKPKRRAKSYAAVQRRASAAASR